MKILKLEGQVEVITGLHIGGGDDTMKIGGIDNGVVKDINTDMPYIPGSSLKGKMRSLLEWDKGLVGIGDGKPFNSKLLKNAIFKDKNKRKDALNIIKIFGNGVSDDKFNEIIPITRISVGDCNLSQETLQKEMKLSEAKYENVIDRQKGTANHPRQTERVPAGVKFDLDIRVKIFDEDDENEIKEIIQRGLELIEMDYLGGNGSRGYGRVKFNYKWSE
jgi:CRISPR-associated protein Csm3